jgi:dTDP-4-dehydrorhamnose reductase
MRVVVFGHRGWIGQYVLPLMIEESWVVVLPPPGLRVDDTEAIENFLKEERPTHVLSLIGRTYGPGFSTIDYLEHPDKLRENICDNLFSPVSLAMTCVALDIHFTYMGTGCIFSEEDPYSRVFFEEQPPNFFGSAYSTVKGFTDRLFHHPIFDLNVLNVRIRMPITADDSPRNFITKLRSYSKICSMPNSMTVLPFLLPCLIQMMKDRRVGTIHLVNPGCITHNEILTMYQSIVEPDFKWECFSIEEQNKVLLAKRSNNRLDTTKFSEWFPDVPDIHTAVKICLNQMAAKRQKLIKNNI